MNLSIRRIDLFRTELQTRMPFKYGIAVMTRVPLAFVRLELEADGNLFRGISSDLLPPKWFTKDPAKAVDIEILEMIEVIYNAARLAEGMRGASPFQIWRELYAAQSKWGEQRGFPPLLTHFGTSLVERALLESFCKAVGKTFSAALRSGDLGLELGTIHRGLAGTKPADFLDAPLKQITVRHTVGLADPLTDDEIVPGEKLDDGLPQSLESCIRRYGLRHFKVKVQGRIEEDLARLTKVSDVVGSNASADYAFSLDGNEQFKEPGAFRAYWEQLRAQAHLRDFFQHLLFVEQPLHRDLALDDAAGECFRDWPDRPPLIIDESDGELGSLPRALELGYAGTSHKNCKGIFKGIANRCLLLHLQRQAPGSPLLMSGEDLANIGPVAVLQDLCVMAALGISSVERNGHHYFRGLSMFSPAIQRGILDCHPDLYEAAADGWPAMKIGQGTIDVGSVTERAPFGVGFEIPLEEFTCVESDKNV
jgi:L-alanine-DL-glutamate epimerase-like enolase superfamily enzyme